MADNVIIQMQDHAENNQYPVTLASIVYDDNGKTVAERLAALEVLLKMFEWDGEVIKAKASFYSVGQVSASKKGEEGEGGSGAGMMLLTEWDDSITDLSSYALGANLGKGLRDEIAAMKSNPASFITLKTINNQSLFGNGNIDVKTTVGWNDIVGRPTNLSEFTDDVVAGKYLPLTGGTMGNTTVYELYTDVWSIGGNPYTLTISRPGYWASSLICVKNTYNSENDYAEIGADGSEGTINTIYFAFKNQVYYQAALRITENALYHKEYTLLHSGNYSSYALPLTGGTMGGHIVMGKNAIVFDLYQSDTWANPQNSGLRILNTVGAIATEALSPYSVGLSVSGYYGFQLASDAGIGAFYYRNTVTGINGSWKLIAFTDSNITGKAGDSDKLGGHEASYYIGQHRDTSQQQDANSITANHITHSSKWLNATESNIMSLFELTYSTDWKSQLLFSPYRQRLYSRFYYNGSTWSDWKQIAFTDSTVEAAKHIVNDNGDYVIYRSGSGNIIVGDNNGAGDTHLLGNNIYLRYGGSATYGLTLNSSGNITIGSTDKLGTNADTKLYIDGGSIIGGKLEITPLNKVYLTFNVDSSRGTIAAFHDGVTRLPIAINPNGGNVLIGTTKDIGYKLDVNGSTHLDAYDGVSYVHIGPVAFGTKIQARGDGNTYFQSQRFDSITAYYNLVLQELGGNVSIGNTKIDSGAKLQVATTFRDTLPSLGSLGSGSDFAIQYTSTYACFGLYFSLDAQSGNTTIQTGRSDGGSATYALLLNPLGGNVGIGTSAPAYKLDVAGTGRFTGLASFDAGVKIGSTTLGNTNLGLSIDTSFYPSSVGLSLGHSSYRWDNVYANDVYTDKVKIGDATLSWDGAALKVDKPFYSTSQVSSGAKAVEAKAVIAPFALLKYPTASTTTEYTDAQIASEYGLTTEVLDNLARGIYTRVTYKSITESFVWDYEVYYISDNKTIILRNGTGSTYNSRNYKFERKTKTNGTIYWTITNA